MKRLILLSLSILFSFSMCFAQNASRELQDFAQDLSSANVKLRADLILFGKYKSDLTSLNYETYLNLLAKSETKSNQGISKMVKNANSHYFASGIKTFYIVIYSQNLKAIICDNANTPFIDSIKLLNINDRIPDLKTFIRK